MKTYLWKIKKDKLAKTNLALYCKFIKKKFNIDADNDFKKLWEWSIKNSEDFWESIWDFTKVKGKKGDTLFKKSNTFYKNKFFPKAKINYAENLLTKNNSDLAIIFRSENGYRTSLNWKQLNVNVSQVSNWMKSNGLNKGDRVAAYLPNIPEAVIAYISSAAVGAVWSSCSPDFGAEGVVSRFSQIKPKILFIGDKYFYNGKKINILERLPEIINKVPSINKIVIVPYPGTKIDKKKIFGNQTYIWDELISLKTIHDFLEESGQKLIQKGVTTLEEVRRVLMEA